MSDTQYKLIYFEARARAEAIRMVFHAAGIQFEDERINFQNWPTRKPTIPGGRLPVLEVTLKDVKEPVYYEESGAIYRMLARRFNLMGSSEEEYYRIERMIGECGDMDKDFYAYHHTPEDKKPDAMKKFTQETVPKMLALITKSLKSSGGQFVAGDALTLGDLVLLTSLDHVDKADPELLKDKYPDLLEFRENVFKANTGLASYIKARPDTSL